MIPIKVPRDIPKSVQRNHRDAVRYKYSHHPGNFTQTSHICYQTILSSLPKVHVVCEPYLVNHPNRSVLSTYHYNLWIAMCRDVGLVSDYVTTWTDSNHRHHLYLPSSTSDQPIERAHAFAALCCYRFADSFPGMVWQIVEHVKAGVGFWQAYHYGCLKCSWNAYHNIAPISIERIYTQPKNMALTLGAQAYFRYKLVRDRGRDQQDIYRRVCSHGQRFGDLIVRTDEMLIQPEFKELYEMDGLNPDKRTFTQRFMEISRAVRL